jgi:amidase
MEVKDMGDELWKLGAVELAEAIRLRRVSSREVVEAHLSRIEAVNPSLNAVAVVLAEQALESAGAADRALAAGEEAGPLLGVPMTVKENIDLIGSATTMGVPALRDSVPPDDAPHVAQLKAAGAIPIGRTNLPDFGLRWHTDNELRGATLNPWDSGRTPGGSSGGDAAALAAGMTPLGMGNDYAGSLRWPSQCCGTTALKPSFGRIPRARTLPDAPNAPLAPQLMAVHGPMARRVRDLRAALHCMSGADFRDPWWMPAPLEWPTGEGPRRVAVCADPAGHGVDPDVAAAVERAAEALGDAGYSVETVEPPGFARAVEIYFQIILGHGQAAPGPVPMEEIVSKDYLRFQEAHRHSFGIACGERSADAFGERAFLAREWSEFLEADRLVLGPVATMQPFEVGFDLAGEEEALSWLRAVRMIVVANLFGLPSVAVPTGVAGGLPQGVQVIGPRFREDLCLDAAEAIEERLGIITPIDASSAR